MRRNLELFYADESGAVTVDWVVLTAAVVGLCVAVVGFVTRAAIDPADGVAGVINNLEINQ